MNVGHPTPQTPADIQRETLGVIAGICRDMERCAMAQDVVGLKTHYGFFRTTMGRLDVIMTNIRQEPMGIERPKNNPVDCF